jgi:predicted nucleotide-binding protein
MSRAKGTKNRNYPSLTLEDAISVGEAIQDRASGMKVSRLTLAELLDRSPSSSAFRELVFASRSYGLTTGGINSEEFELTMLGGAATGPDEVARDEARRKAVLNIEPYRAFLTAFTGKRVPSPVVFREFLVKSAGVASERAAECADMIVADARFAKLLRTLKGVDYVELAGVAAVAFATGGDDAQDGSGSDDEGGRDLSRAEDAGAVAETDQGAAPFRARASEDTAGGGSKKVFIAHGKNRVPLTQLKEMLDKFKVRYAVAIDEPNKGRPISAKVGQLMRDECSSAIFIFTADERFERKDDQGERQEVWRPSENVIFELGAASVLYDRRIVIFKEKGVSFPTDFSDLGHIEFDRDQLVREMGSLFSELVALDILEVRAKG